MKFIRPVVLATVFTFVGSAAWAAEQDDHKIHHPEAAGFSSNAPKTTAGNAVAKESMNRMDTQMKTMREIHEKMMNAKTPEERNVVMAEHMKAMQDSMSMMGGMGGDAIGQMKGGMPADMATRQQMMEKRMEMMESMMQMMMDRMPASPAK